MLRATAQERARGALSPGTLAAVRAEFLASGFVTLDGVMEPEALAALRPWCDLHAAQQLAVKLHESPEAGGGLSGAGGFPRGGRRFRPVRGRGRVVGRVRGCLG